MAQDHKFELVFNLISEELREIVESEPDFYDGYKVELTSELLYSKKINFSPKTIYIAVKFLKASTYYNQTSLPVTLSVLAEQNSFVVARTLIMDFITQYNLQKSSDESILQKYETPTVMNNFNEVGNGFRTLFIVSCGFLISENNNPIKNIVYTWQSVETIEGVETTVTHEEVIKPLASGFSLTNNLDSQAFYSTKNLTTSVAQMFTFGITFQTYRFQNSHLFKIIQGMIEGSDSVEGDIKYNYNDTIFDLKLTFRDGSVIRKDMRMVSVNGSQPVDGLPTDSYSFTC